MKRFLLVTLLLSVVWSLFAQDKALAIRNNLLEEGNNSVLVVSHRADWRNAPENSLQAIRNCIEMGVDMVEIDLKKTKDGHLILLHDNTLDRTTTGKGKPEEYTLAEIKKMRLRNGCHIKTSTRFPLWKKHC